MLGKNILITGASGLIGSEVASFYCDLGFRVYGVDNNMRQKFFGNSGSTLLTLKRLENKYSNFTNHSIDIRDRVAIEDLVNEIKPYCLVHTAAQPSHDKAASIPFIDFEVNAVGTLNLIESVRRYSKDTIFVHLSTNKVYGDTPNKLPITELETRWELKEPYFKLGTDETMSIDNSMHSLFGVSKASSDLIVQEYGRYFGLQTCCLRGGCLTGPSHSGVELHGSLNYLIRCNLSKSKYIIYGYEGKQVRDNIHSIDVVKFINEFVKNPKIAAVYNLGGGFENSISLLESFKKIESITGINMITEYDNRSRLGDHICYYSNLNKIKKDFPNWKITKNIDDIFEDVYKTLKINNS